MRAPPADNSRTRPLRRRSMSLRNVEELTVGPVIGHETRHTARGTHGLTKYRVPERAPRTAPEEHQNCQPTTYKHRR
jgi:hypothetical protein